MFKGWKKYLSLAIPSTLMLCSEWWAFELLTIMAGWIGVNEQAIAIVLFNIDALVFMIAYGF